MSIYGDVKRFFSGEDVDVRFLRAVKRGDVEKAEKMLSSGAHIDTADIKSLNSKDLGDTALHLVMRKGDQEMATMLLKKGANPNIVNSVGETPLHAASLANNQVGAELLVQKGGDVNAVDSFGNRPLHYASKAPMAQLLLENGAEVNAKRFDAKTPLDTMIARSTAMQAQEALDAKKLNTVLKQYGAKTSMSLPKIDGEHKKLKPILEEVSPASSLSPSSSPGKGATAQKSI